MKAWRFVLAGLFLPAAVPAQTPAARPPTAAEIEQAQMVKLNALGTRGNEAARAKAWFNISALRYNKGDVDGAIAAADQVIALDPAKADAYFIKGSCLFGNGTVGVGGKFVVSAETMATLRKYLELAPDGAHAADVKQMLESAVVLPH